MHAAAPFAGLWRCLCAGLLVAALSGGVQAVEILWPFEGEHELAGLHDDNTGAVFVLTPKPEDGGGALKVIPSGRAVETKLALPLEGDRLAKAAGAAALGLRLYVPPESDPVPTMLFLGLADVTAGWTWIDGVFAPGAVGPGWNDVTFVLSPAMRRLDPQRRYVMYLAFAGFDAAGQKIPLRTPFFIDAVWARPPAAFAAPAHAVSEEIEALLALDDDALLDEIARRAFAYLWNEANPRSGLIRDRSTPGAPASIAAVGFGLSAIPIGVERGWISREEGYERALRTLTAFASGQVAGYRGFFYHFVDMETGHRVWASELSSIDTALFIAGALTVGSYFAGTEVAELADALYAAVEWDWMRNGRTTLSMGWKPETGFLPYHWNHFDESLLLYVLAIGSPTHPVPAAAWHAVARPWRDGVIAAPGGTLFVYQYPLAWLDLRHVRDAYANYWENAVRAAVRNREFTRARADAYASYAGDVWGLSASDGPFGYRAYGAEEGNHDGTIAPYASAASVPLVPDLALRSIRGMLERYGTLVWGRYGFVSAFNADLGWYSDAYLGIDLGITLLMIENYRTGLVWNLFMRHPAVQAALQLIGFVPDTDAAAGRAGS